MVSRFCNYLLLQGFQDELQLPECFPRRKVWGAGGPRQGTQNLNDQSEVRLLEIHLHQRVGYSGAVHSVYPELQ